MRPAPLAALAVALALGPAVSAHAAGVFEPFEALCIKGHANPQAALAAADASGWMPLPDVMLNEMSKGGEFKEIQGRLKTSGSEFQLALVGYMSTTVKGQRVRMRMCAVASLPPDKALKERIAAWAAVPPDDAFGSGSLTSGYVFADENGAHRHVTRNDEDAWKLYQSGRLTFAALQEDREMSMAVLAVPNPEPSPT